MASSGIVGVSSWVQDSMMVLKSLIEIPVKDDECAGKEGVTLSRGSVFMNRLRSDERV